MKIEKYNRLYGKDNYNYIYINNKIVLLFNNSSIFLTPVNGDFELLFSTEP